MDDDFKDLYNEIKGLRVEIRDVSDRCYKIENSQNSLSFQVNGVLEKLQAHNETSAKQLEKMSAEVFGNGKVALRQVINEVAEDVNALQANEAKRTRDREEEAKANRNAIRKAVAAIVVSAILFVSGLVWVGLRGASEKFVRDSITESK